MGSVTALSLEALFPGSLGDCAHQEKLLHSSFSMTWGEGTGVEAESEWIGLQGRASDSSGFGVMYSLCRRFQVPQDEDMEVLKVSVIGKVWGSR